MSTDNFFKESFADLCRVLSSLRIKPALKLGGESNLTGWERFDMRSEPI